MFHLTAITHRKDALFQTVTIGGKHLARTDTAQLTTVKTESAAWAGLVTAVREPVAVFATPSSGGMYNVRVSLRQRVPGEARNAIAAVFGSMAEAKQVFVFDDDIDVFSDEQCDWALATRYQGDRDTIQASGLSRGAARSVARRRAHRRQDRFRLHHPVRQAAVAGMGHSDAAGDARGRANGKAGNGGQSVADTLAAGPASFLELMVAAGTRDGREIVRELDALYARRHAQRATRAAATC